MRDQGPCYKGFVFRNACKALALTHIRINPAPQDIGNADRFIQTPVREWSYTSQYPSSEYRKSVLVLHNDNWHRGTAVKTQNH